MKHPHVMTIAVNRRRHEVVVDARRTLVDLLRHDLGYVGTRVGCEQGICGACTVLLDGEPVRSCLIFGVQADGCSVETVVWRMETSSIPCKRLSRSITGSSAGSARRASSCSRRRSSERSSTRARSGSVKSWPLTCAAAQGIRGS